MEGRGPLGQRSRPCWRRHGHGLLNGRDVAVEIQFMEPARNAPVRLQRKTVSREEPVKAPASWLLWIAVYCRSPSLEKPPMLLELLLLLLHLHCRDLPRGAPWDQNGKALPPAMSGQCPLLLTLNIVPAGKGNLFKGSGSIFAE